MTVIAPCPACEVDVDVLGAFDAGECPECSTPRHVFEALADGIVTRDELEGDTDFGFIIPPKVRREIEEEREQLDDPAEQSQYLREVTAL